MPTLSLQDLRNILRESPGLFKSTPEILTSLQSQQADFRTKFPDVDSTTESIRIADLRNNIQDYPSDFTHLSFSLAINQSPGSPGNTHLHLVLIGAKLNMAADADLTQPPLQISSTQFSNLNPTPTAGIAINHRRFRKRFQNRFRVLFSNQKIVHGLYIRLSTLSEMLTEFSNEMLTHINISFGFMKAVDEDDWNCFHLIFQGFNPENNTQSTNTYSTFDGVPGYSGPKPGCPPFNEPEEGAVTSVE
jgi:hypothetical protein